jgi:Flp pilus assembly protein TadD
MAIKVDPTNKIAYRILGAALAGMQDYPAAIASFKKLIGLDPQDYTAYIFIGKSLASMGEWEKSLTVFQQAWFLNKDHPAANVGRAVALFELNRIDEASKAANLALENISESPEDAYNLGMLYLEGLNDPDSAITALITALLDDPGNRECLITLAKAAIRSDAPNAIQQVTDFLDAADPNLGIEFAWTVHRLGSWDAHISAHKADFLPRVNTFKGIARSFSDNPVYQLRIDLEDARPPIWRRVLVPGYYTLADLHHIIQAVMGWEGYHRHEFDVNHVSVGPIMDSGRAWSTRYLVDERDVTLAEAVTASSGKFRYLYDSVDYWIHKIAVEKTLTYDENIRYPVCTGGRRAAPPENSGGIRGYYAHLEAFDDPVSKLHEESVRLLGKDFRPDVFDIDAINRRLETIRRQPVE